MRFHVPLVLAVAVLLAPAVVADDLVPGMPSDPQNAPHMAALVVRMVEDISGQDIPTNGPCIETMMSSEAYPPGQPVGFLHETYDETEVYKAWVLETVYIVIESCDLFGQDPEGGSNGPL